MEYPKHLFKAPGAFGSGAKSYNVAGAAEEDQEAELVARGWHTSMEAAWAAVALDHDGDGKAGGSLKQTGTDLAKLRAGYKALAGKKAFGGWDEATLRARLAELKESK